MFVIDLLLGVKNDTFDKVLSFLGTPDSTEAVKLSNTVMNKVINQSFVYFFSEIFKLARIKMIVKLITL